MDYHTIHCPKCGRIIRADELAFDLGEIIQKALEKEKSRPFGSIDKWYLLTNFNLCLYLTVEDLARQYGIKNQHNHTYSGLFEFKVKHLTSHIVELSNSTDPNFSIDVLASNENAVEYDALTRAMAKRRDVDRKALAMEIRELAQMLKKKPDETVITSFFVTVRMDQDDQDNWFANRLVIEFDDHEKKNFTSFVCKGEKGHPCGKKLYELAGKYKEIIIGIVGSPGVGKKIYLSALIASILREGNYTNSLGYPQGIIKMNVFFTKEYQEYVHNHLHPYITTSYISKAPSLLGVRDEKYYAGSSFHLCLIINRITTYIFTFAEMPGEIYCDNNVDVNDIIENRRITVNDADIIWYFISYDQIMEEIRTSSAVQLYPTPAKKNNIPVTVLVTKSDLALKDEEYELYYYGFNPFEGNENSTEYIEVKTQNTPWVNRKGELYYSNMKWFIQKTLDFLQATPNLCQRIVNVIGPFTPFAVSSFGRDINDLVDFELRDSLPKPSMIEAPFLWTLAALGLIDVYKEELVTEEYTKGFIFKRTITEQKLKNVKIDKEHLDQIIYYR